MKPPRAKHSEETRRQGKRPRKLSLDQAAAVLRKFDIKELFKLSARLSLHESLTKENDPLSISSYFQFEVARILSNLILCSGARRRKSIRLPFSDDLISVLNACIDAMDDRRELQLFHAADKTDRVYLETQRFMARLSLIQISAQEPLPRYRSARLMAMLTTIPDRFSEDIPGTERTKVLATLSKMEASLGARLSDLFRAFAILMSWQKITNDNCKIAIQGRARRHVNNRCRATILSFLHPEPLLEEYLFFTSDRVATTLFEGYPDEAERAKEQLEGFLKLAAKTIKELIDLSQMEPYRIGHAGKRLSPLERYPIVKFEPLGLELPSGYIIPNHRHFVPSFSKIVDFTLFEILGDDYARARGALLHLYLQKAVQARLPGVILIPETPFRSKHGEKRSPDFTLIEESTKTLIAVEVKGKALSLQARVALNSSPLKELDDLYSAIGKLPGKIADLRAGKPEFNQWKSAIAETDNCILLGILREGSPVGMARLVREEARQDPQNPLNSVIDPFSVLAADTFERAIETAAKTGRPLSELLKEHWRVSSGHDYSRDDTDMFGDRDLLEETSFARQLISEQSSDS